MTKHELLTNGIDFLYSQIKIVSQKVRAGEDLHEELNALEEAVQREQAELSKLKPNE